MDNYFLRELQVLQDLRDPDTLVSKVRNLNQKVENEFKFKCFLKILKLKLKSHKDHGNLLEIFLEFAIKANNPAITLDFLQGQDIIGVNVENLLLITYYKAILYLMLKKKRQATEELKKILIIPCHVTSQIQVEALRKLLLVQVLCLSFNDVVKLPPSNGVGRVLLKEAEKYYDFVDVYKSGNLKKLKEFLDKEGDVFSRHGNLGLLKQVLSPENYLTRKFRKLQKVYSRIYVSDLGPVKILRIPSNTLNMTFTFEEITTEEFENFLVNLHNTGIVIDDRSGEIRFTPTETISNLQEISDRLKAICDKFSEFNRDLQTSEEYVSRISRSEMGEGSLFDDRLQDLDF